MAQSVKNLSTMQETACNAGDQVASLDLEDPLEKEMATHSSILAWKIQWTEESGVLQSTGLQELDTTERLNHINHREQFGFVRHITWASPVAHLVENPPAVQKTPVPFLGRDDLLEKG